MTVRSRTIVILAVVAVLTAVVWWRSPQTASIATLPGSTSASTHSSQAPPSTDANSSPPSSSRPSPASPAASSSDPVDQAEVEPTPGTTPSAQIQQARAQWRPVVVGFARAYTSHQDNPADWRAALGRYSAPAVSQALADSSPKQAATHSRYVSYEILEYRDDEVAAQVSYADGTALVLYVAQDDGPRWNVRAFDRLAE